MTEFAVINAIEVTDTNITKDLQVYRCINAFEL